MALGDLEDLIAVGAQLGHSRGAHIQTAVCVGHRDVVGVPLWLWTDVTPQTWGPNSATASVPGLAVTATAEATRIVWDMGDGNQVTCGNPGTAYYRGAPVDSPTCEYVGRPSPLDSDPRRGGVKCDSLT